jgi:hypothetical protein
MLADSRRFGDREDGEDGEREPWPTLKKGASARRRFVSEWVPERGGFAFRRSAMRRSGSKNNSKSKSPCPPFFKGGKSNGN